MGKDLGPFIIYSRGWYGKDKICRDSLSKKSSYLTQKMKEEII